MRKRFDGLDGVIFEGCGVSHISIYEDAAVSIPITASYEIKESKCVFVVNSHNVFSTGITTSRWKDSVVTSHH